MKINVGFTETFDVLIDRLKRKYPKEVFDINTKLDDILEPTSVIFERDNSWGVLFECDCDIENGLAVFIKNGEIKVGSQDDFL